MNSARGLGGGVSGLLEISRVVPYSGLISVFNFLSSSNSQDTKYEITNPGGM